MLKLDIVSHIVKQYQEYKYEEEIPIRSNMVWYLPTNQFASFAVCHRMTKTQTSRGEKSNFF